MDAITIPETVSWTDFIFIWLSICFLDVKFHVYNIVDLLSWYYIFGCVEHAYCLNMLFFDCITCAFVCTWGINICVSFAANHLFSLGCSWLCHWLWLASLLPSLYGFVMVTSFGFLIQIVREMQKMIELMQERRYAFYASFYPKWICL